MRFELYGQAVDARRFALFVAAPLVCLVVAAALFLPAGLQLGLTLLFALPFLLFGLDRPAAVFYLVVLVLFSNLDVYAPVHFYRYLVLFLLAAFALAVANGRRVVTHHPHLVALAAALMIVVFQSLSVASDYGRAAHGMGSFFKVLIAVAIVAQFTGDRKGFRRFLLVLTAGMLLSAYLPFVVHPPSRYASLSMIWNRGIVRYEGFVFEPNTFALYQLFLIPVLVFFAAAYRRSRLAVALAAILILGSIANLSLSFSRGGFFGLACLLGALVVVERRNKPFLLFGLLFVAAGIVAVPGVYWERIGSVFDFATQKAGDYAIYTRLATSRTALRLGLEHPLLGVGMDSFLPSAAYFIPYSLAVHNVFLQMFADLGVVALSLFVAIIACNGRIIARLMRSADAETAQMGRALLLQHVGVFASALFMPVAYEMMVWFTLALPAIAEHAYGSGAGADGAGAPVSSGRK
jgi:O-antigen ligase